MKKPASARAGCHSNRPKFPNHRLPHGDGAGFKFKQLSWITTILAQQPPARPQIDQPYTTTNTRTKASNSKGKKITLL
jgi:hypothetical protein